MKWIRKMSFLVRETIKASLYQDTDIIKTGHVELLFTNDAHYPTNKWSVSSRTFDTFMFNHSEASPRVKQWKYSSTSQCPAGFSTFH